MSLTLVPPPQMPRPMRLLIAFVPTAIVIGIMAAWRSVVGTALYATARMLVQLLLIGYVLIYIFRTDNWLIIAGVLLIMLTVSSWIAIRTLGKRTPHEYLRALVAIAAGGVSTLGLVTQFVITIEPWFSPRYVVPLAGMIFAEIWPLISERSTNASMLCSTCSSWPTSSAGSGYTSFAVSVV